MTRRTRLAIAGLLVGSLALTSADAFIFRRLRARRSSSSRRMLLSRQSRGMSAMFTRNRTRSSAGSYAPRWNVEGQWSYSDDFLADHLRTVHKVNVEGFSRDQMEKIHDNLHNNVSTMNGVAALGGSPCAGCPLSGCCPSCKDPEPQEEVVVVEEVVEVAPVVEGIAPVRSSSSSCPSGTCPTSSSSRPQRRGLFRWR